MTKKTIESTIESTMIGPLWARAKYGAIYPEILTDSQAESILKKVFEIYPEYQEEFEIMKKFMDEFASLNFLYRAKKFDNEIREYKINHPSAVIINLGCGLDTSNLRIGDNHLTWYQIDLPEGIKLREKIITPSPNSKNIAKSIFDYTWFDEIKFDKEQGVLIYAAGLFNYFKEEKLKEFCNKAADYFTGGVLLFDLPSDLLKNILNKKYKKLRVKGVDHEFGLGNPERILKWSSKIKKMSCSVFFKTIILNSKWNKRTRILMNVFKIFNFYKFIRLEFK